MSAHVTRAARSLSNASSTKFGLARSISIGTDLTKSSLTWQASRPWHMDGQSNLAEDNAMSMERIFKGKKVALFGVPAPFTGVCTQSHVPPYEKLHDEFIAKGFDTVMCYSVSCPYANYNWAKAMDAKKVTFVSDVEGKWSEENGLTEDYTAASLGFRSRRFSMVVDDGIVKTFNEVEDAQGDAAMLLTQG
uniref:Redoxin domain-containing protein n=1 Tax=Corethron hystrix TaxID=216773 RepID=A0A7S1C0Z8_9STRA|mmetsp:Transcript_8129/g.17656  ORF Transcript_8129/g.17656 Transcript_8129/m.17656 type:complete len:191 (+) Transcript_8129:187-759(+)|eukprot:CAMPEP_0113313128 /NCGR_PEP_ID=MMETSP0010_2-20120614/9674_1 /TAXON_ID=216773 ORGANISM="Corethron hystrix, Strain 308" /NCGR_SAMPLE_ID=MMETSP0010_2 /ASSEMBLY_ACC=CAM_ASM_000155 /LENGTH=190 /DNA_ID=CAMNT_0000169075 /DNA_START=145 /DNA_END=717 /DNA_ORIENTATION=+ /assembly_acc=CAM_ASM_000155